ncbi:MAG: glycosyltransferase family 4 protein [Burkholderiaceae bacterium]
MRVLLVSPKPPPVGGIATWTNVVLNSPLPAGVELRALDTGIRWRSLVADNFAWTVIGGIGHGIQTLLELIWLLVSWRPRVVHLCTAGRLGMFRDIVFIVVSRCLGAKVCLHFHRSFKRSEVAEFSDRERFEKKLVMIACSLSNAVFVINEATRSELSASMGERKVRRISNMVSCITEEELNALKESRDKATILFVGHVLESKGVIDLIEAATRLPGGHQGFRVDVVGTVSASMRSQIAEKYPFDWVNLVGELQGEQVVERMKVATLLCLPSYSEGFPFVILEAMSVGTPIVATPVGAIGEALADGAGVLVPVGDPTQLANALQRLLSDPRQREAIGDRGWRRCVEMYSTQAQMRVLIEEWERVLS